MLLKHLNVKNIFIFQHEFYSVINHKPDSVICFNIDTLSETEMTNDLDVEKYWLMPSDTDWQALW